MATHYIANEKHYTEVLERFKTVKNSLWIGTADIKDVYVQAGEGSQPLLKTLSDLVKHDKQVRLLHAKEPGPNFRKDFDKFPALFKGLQRALCPRVHFKIFIFDEKIAYIGSANLTGAGVGMKSPNNRNFEAGILTSGKELVDQAMIQFDTSFKGKHCKNCGRKAFCPDPIA